MLLGGILMLHPKLLFVGKDLSSMKQAISARILLSNYKKYKIFKLQKYKIFRE